jgi:chorismate mutase
MQEIDRLRAELERRDEELVQLLAWINGDSDALTVLQRTYMDPRTSTPDRIKAAGAAIGYELCVHSAAAAVGKIFSDQHLKLGLNTKPLRNTRIEAGGIASKLISLLQKRLRLT